MSIESIKLREYVEKLIEEHLPAKQKEKSELGEVFTPVQMIETSYDHFPKKIWKNPLCTWLDPAGGIGNFPLVLFFWLMIGLNKKIPNKTKRAKHIIEKMIFIVEINSDNVSVCKKIFKTLCPSATPNIYQGDFLTLDTSSINWPSSFDCIIKLVFILIILFLIYYSLAFVAIDPRLTPLFLSKHILWLLVLVHLLITLKHL